ncbi:Transposon Tf2-9 polyprotein isoform A [Glycine soja]|uniref:Transposon Tf2-9 polyprotein isoform A n=1 Tax=Glycine soja TaxID=3848 RepID=A0A445IL52_GLYSO|nr:Transposon Tf2-9 polyprotein isoform A [Glycine soja]
MSHPIRALCPNVLWHEDPQYVDLLHNIKLRPDAHSNLAIHKDLIFRQGSIWIPFPTPFTALLLEEFHSSPLDDHTGVSKTLHHLRQNFDWPHIQEDVRRYIVQCPSCEQTKYETKKAAGLLQPLPIPSHVWEDLSLDFIIGLLSSHGFTMILVFVDRFSKGAHFGALPAHHTAYKKDGQMEVLNQTLEQYLRAYVHHQPSQWFRFLLLAKWSYNTTIHSGTGVSPFKAIYGKPPPTLIQYLQGTCSIDAVDSLLTTRTEIDVALTDRRLAYQAVCRWDITTIEQPPDYMKACFKVLYNISQMKSAPRSTRSTCGTP